MGNPVCDAVSVPEGFTCERTLGHLALKHEHGGVLWADYPSGVSPLCLAVSDEPGPLPSRCNRLPHDDDRHEATEHGRILYAWEG